MFAHSSPTPPHSIDAAIAHTMPSFEMTCDAIEDAQTSDDLLKIISDFAAQFSMSSMMYFHAHYGSANQGRYRCVAAIGREYEIDSAPQIPANFEADSLLARLSGLHDGQGLCELANDEIDNHCRCLILDMLKPSTHIYAIPLNRKFGHKGHYIFGLNATFEVPSPMQLRRLTWVCQHGFHRYCKLLTLNEPRQTSLSKREQEILYWVSKGKSNSVIADIIGISRHTVNGYLRSIFLKTGTSDRTTAALNGLVQNLIAF